MQAVVARPAAKFVAAASTVELVVTGATVDHVSTGPPVHDVVSRAGVDEIGPRGRADDVASARPFEDARLRRARRLGIRARPEGRPCFGHVRRLRQRDRGTTADGHCVEIGRQRVAHVRTRVDLRGEADEDDRRTVRRPRGTARDALVGRRRRIPRDR